MATFERRLPIQGEPPTANYRVADAVALVAVAVAPVAAAAAAVVAVARRIASLFRHKNVACFALFTKCARRSTLLCKEGCTIYPKMAVANDDDWPGLKRSLAAFAALGAGGNKLSLQQHQQLPSCRAFVYMSLAISYCLYCLHAHSQFSVLFPASNPQFLSKYLDAFFGYFGDWIFQGIRHRAIFDLRTQLKVN